jgi:DNA-binding CsgD family transcriptional regulator
MREFPHSLLPDNAAPAILSGRGFKTSVIEAIADWCDALHREMPLQEAFAGLVRALGAEAGMIVRTRLNDFLPVRIVVHDDRSRTVHPLKASFADDYFGPHLVRPRAATVWLGSTHSDERSAKDAVALPEWQSERGMKEFAVLVLSGGPVVRDHIELHFRETLSSEVQASLGAVLPTMARTWATRRVGLIACEAIAERHSIGSRKRGGAAQPILGVSNPARFSRGEFRVCMLLSRGLSVVGVSKELGITEATVRSHLRSIYAKTDTANLAELVFQLVKSQGSTNEWEARSA